MKVNVSLHSHSREGSHDASLTERKMARVYRKRGFGVAAVTDHDTWTSVFSRKNRLTGIERTLDEQRYLHVVELRGGFSFLAHPKRPFPENTKKNAIEFVRTHGLDGVEKYSQGREQYGGRIHSEDIVELANDDAHNQRQVGLSYMRVDADKPTPDAVLDAVRDGRVELVNNPSWRRQVVGKARQAVELATSVGQRSVRRE